MSSNIYYGVKDAENNTSFSNIQWLTPYELLNKLRINNLHSFTIDRNELVYPNELLYSQTCNTATDNNLYTQASNYITDLLLLAKYTDKYGNLKLKSVLLSNIIDSLQTNTSTNGSPSSSKILVLSLPKDSYYWSLVDNAHLIPSYALRVGFDNIAKQFSYIGRMKVASLLNRDQNPSQQPTSPSNRIKNKITNLIGTLTNIYEFIPAIVLQLHDLSYLEDDKKFSVSIYDNTAPVPAPPASPPQQHHYQNHQYFSPNRYDSIWSRLRSAINNKNTNDLDFNLISTNYEVLCLKKQPATLKQLCIVRLVKSEEEARKQLHDNNLLNKRLDLKQYDILNSFRSLPNSLSYMLWPSFLVPGQCIIKTGKMRSLNGKYELNINSHGIFRLVKIITGDEYSYLSKYMFGQLTTTFEKNVESLLVSNSGVYLIYDNNQATRRPKILYKHTVITNSQNEPSTCSFLSNDYLVNESLFDNLLSTSFILELSDNGFLRVIIQNSSPFNRSLIQNRPIVINLLDLNEFFYPLNAQNENDNKESKIITLTGEPQTTVNNQNSVQSVSNSTENVTSGQSSFINVRLVANLNDLKNLPVKIIHLVISIIKTIFQNILNRVPVAHLH